MEDNTKCIEEENGEKKEKSNEEIHKEFLSKVIKPYPHCVICKEKTVK